MTGKSSKLRLCAKKKTLRETICLPLASSLPLQLLFHSTFVFSPDPCILKEILLGYWLVKWLNLLAVLRVSSVLHTQCFGAVCADGNPRDFAFKTWQWMQQQQCPLLTADKGIESQLLRQSWVTQWKGFDELWNQHPIEHTQKSSVSPSYRVSCYIVSGHSSFRCPGVYVPFVPVRMQFPNA